MNNILYLEGSCGISGDMTVAALLDLGADKKKLDIALNSLPEKEFNYQISYKNSYGIRGCDFNVVLPSFSPDHHHNDHKHRCLSDINALIDQTEMSGKAKKIAKEIFLVIARAESKAHGCSIDQVHFHEVGAIDSIVDIVSVAVLIDDLQIDDCIVTGLTEGSGFIQCQHGALPVPVPAVLNIAQESGIALRHSNIHTELVTPTGIGIAAVLRTRATLPEQFKIIKTGIGLGKREIGQANMLRAMIIKDDDIGSINNHIYVIECNIDDASGEELGFCMEKLLMAGAKDVHFIPCIMKKNRPAYILKVITDKENLSIMEDVIFRCTSTIGLRKYVVERTCMQRVMKNIQIYGCSIAVKKCFLNDIVRYYPEYDSVKVAAEKTGCSFRELYEKAALQAKEQDE